MRPYISPKDFLNRVKPSKRAMISLIKGGAFDKMIDRKLCMAWYIWETCDKKARLTLQNMSTLTKYNLLPTDTNDQIMARRVYEFNRYLKAVCKCNPEYYRLDDRATNFIVELGCDSLLKSLGTQDIYLNAKEWDKKVYQVWMDIFRTWMSVNKETILQNLNEKIFLEDWAKYAKGTISAWEMEALCFYYNEHELAHVNSSKYGFVDFYQLNEDPEVEAEYPKNGKTIKIFKLHKICGTCIAKNKTKSTVTLLTASGVVEVKFRKEYFTLFDKQISAKDEDGVKHIVEKSWFNGGSMIVVMGIRSGDNFIVKKYNSTSGHQLYKIDSIEPNGDLTLRSSRYQGDYEEDD
jgi:DNA polymerase-3 subunit alpha